jgi:integrase
MNVLLAITPSTDYPQMAQVLPWCMEQAGYAPYVDAVKQAVQDTRLTATEASALPPAGTGRVTMKLPEKMEPAGMHVPINILQEILQQVKTYRYSQLYIPLLLAGMCGLRISEICGLQDTDVTSKHIQVRFNFLRAGNELSLQPLKTKAAARVVPVIAAVAREINEYRRFIARCKKTAVSQRMELEKRPEFLGGDPAWQESGHFFVHPQDGRPLGREYVERQWKQFKRSPEMLPLISKYPELANMRLHDFRHSFGSNLRYAGAPIEDVTEILGHTNSNFTRVTYALPLQGTHERSMQRLEMLMKNIVN